MKKKTLKWHIGVTDRNLANAILLIQELMQRVDTLEQLFEQMDVVQKMHETKCETCARAQLGMREVKVT